MSKYVAWPRVEPIAVTPEEREAIRIVNDAHEAIAWEKKASWRQRQIEHHEKYYRKHPEFERDESLIALYAGPRRPTLDASLNSVGMYEDGRLYNPNGYPEVIVRRAVEPKYAEWKEKREICKKDGIAQAVVTRKRRREKLIHDTAAKIVRNERTGPRSSCIICKKKLSDDESIARGIGSDCWQGVLSWIEREKVAA